MRCISHTGSVYLSVHVFDDFLFRLSFVCSHLTLLVFFVYRPFRLPIRRTVFVSFSRPVGMLRRSRLSCISFVLGCASSIIRPFLWAALSWLLCSELLFGRPLLLVRLVALYLCVHVENMSAAHARIHSHGMCVPF